MFLKAIILPMALIALFSAGLLFKNKPFNLGIAALTGMLGLALLATLVPIPAVRLAAVGVILLTTISFPFVRARA
jgi:hypothetical protein